jgi:hypothetical protein
VRAVRWRCGCDRRSRHDRPPRTIATALALALSLVLALARGTQPARNGLLDAVPEGAECGRPGLGYGLAQQL